MTSLPPPRYSPRLDSLPATAARPPSAFQRLRTRYGRFEPMLGVLAFGAGVVWDTVTLTRVDRFSDNLILLAYLLVLGALLVVHHRCGLHPERWPRLAPRRALLDYAARWFLGGLFSAYAVLYFKSASTGLTLSFVLALVALLVVTEFRPARAGATRLRVALFCLSAFSFLLFFIPVVTGYLGAGVFPVAWFGALVLAVGVGWAMEHGTASAGRVLRSHLAVCGGVLLALFVLDRLEIIPPIPLALVERGVFHDVQRTDAGYELRYRRPSWPPIYNGAWRRDDAIFHLAEGDRAFCFTAVFAPSGTALEVVHVWAWDDPAAGWTVTDRIPFTVEGGRGGGYRGFTAKRALWPGDWRVRVETVAGRELGRCAFTAVPGGPEPVEWVTRVSR